MAVARASVADIRSESLAVRAAWQPGHHTLAADMTVPWTRGRWKRTVRNQPFLLWLVAYYTFSTPPSWTNDKSSKQLHCFTRRRRQAALLFSGYEARARWYPLLQGSRLAATAISIYIGLAGQPGVARAFALRAEVCRFAPQAPLSFLASRSLHPEVNTLPYEENCSSIVELA